MKKQKFNPKEFLGLKALSPLEDKSIKGGTKQKQKQKAGQVSP